MPAYAQGSTNLPLQALFPGDTATVINAETLAVNYISSAVCLTPGRFGELQSFSVEIAFSAAPGTFTFLVETSDSDIDANYITEPTNGSITAVGSPSATVARVEFSAIRAKFVRLKLSVAIQNAVTVTAKISR